MSVFISYSNDDADFVDMLAAELIKNNIKVWKDKWKISVGDSLINKILDGIEGASYLCVVISNNALKSEWVETEIEAALSKEKEGKHIVILPILIDDCAIPSLLKDKLYADFRKDFHSGLKQILSVVGKKYNIHDSGRICNKTEESDYFFDYAIENGYSNNNRFFMNIDIVSFDREEDFSILTQINFLGNEYSKEVHFELKEGESIKTLLLRTCTLEFNKNPAHVKIDGNNVIREKFTLHDVENNPIVDVSITIKRLGVTSGSVVFNIGALFNQICVNCGINVSK